MKITVNTSMEQLVSLPDFKAMKGQFISAYEDFFSGEKIKLTLAALQQMNPTWNAEDIVFGLSQLQKTAQSMKQYVFPIYSEAEIQEDPSLSQASLIWMPSPQKTKDTYAILTAGGAYGAVCTMVEALPVAAKLNELGMDCFCLNYRTARPESFLNGLMPKPLDDLANAIRLIKRYSGYFDVQWNNYLVSGYSAGGHLCAAWGTAHLGYRKYMLPAPQALVPVYPLITLENLEESPLKEYLCKGLFGQNYSQEDIQNYAIQLHLDERYPKTYLIQCEDDHTVSEENTRLVYKLLLELGVECKLEMGKSGGHGFGLGSATDVSGWVNRVLDFLS